MRDVLLSVPGSIDFHAQHSPMGAFMSFTCGKFSARGGLGLEIGHPADQDIYIGVKDGERTSPAVPRCLPFYRGADRRAAESYLVEQAGPAEQAAESQLQPYAPQQIRRFYGWATDHWITEDLEFSIYTPFGPIPDPAHADPGTMRRALLPAVVARLVVDNRRGSIPRTAFFALRFAEPGCRALEAWPTGSSDFRLGFAHRRSLGVAAELRDPDTHQPEHPPFLFMRWTVNEGLLARTNAVHMLAHTAGIGFEVPPGRRYELILAFGGYLDHIVTTRLEGRYLYTRYFGSLEDVLSYALDQADTLIAEAARLDAALAASGLSEHQQFLIAHATRSYYGSTQLLDIAGEPFWIVNEGEYCMMNTLDLAVDQVFWELKHNPWVVRNLLVNFVRYYSYHDHVKDRDGRLFPGGISFCHDMGAHNNFAPFSHSSYELPDLTGCFSYMTQEQLCNWILMAACYVARTADRDWLEEHRAVILDCLNSMVHRGGSAGFAQFDSSRCGSGQEITTYDSLDHSLAQTRNNLYIAVKCWAAYLGLAMLLECLGEVQQAQRARRQAAQVARAIVAQAADGVIPAVFEPDSPGFASRILPAVEALVYPWYWQQQDPAHRWLDRLAEEPDHAALLAALKRHTQLLLLDPQKRNLFPDGGIRLSSTSANSWMSKIALFQHVARRVLHLDVDPAIAQLFARADAAHVRWQIEGSGYWACSDQFVDGVARASRYYPRIITTALWLEPADSSASA